MIDQLTQLINQFGETSVVKNKEVPNELNDQVKKVASDSILESLAGIAKKGDTDMLTSFLNSNAQSQSNPVFDLIKNQVVSNLSSKVGLGKKQAGSVADGLIPQVLGSLVGKAKDPNVKGFDVADILKSLTGGDQKASGSLLTKIGTSLLDQNGDGKLDLGDLMSALSGNQKTTPKGRGSKTKPIENSGLGGLLGKLFK